MNTYDPNQLGIKPPQGGFQEGGWYSGRQFVGGTLGDPGVIHPASSQVGAGQAVSPQVVAQTNPNNQAYIGQQVQQQPANAVPTSTGLPAGSPAGIGTGMVTPQATIDLPSMYQNLYKSSGVSDLETQLSEKQKAFTDVKAKNNDNPFLSEATRVGREAKLQKSFDEQTANLMKDIATKKADIETQLNLQTKQFDINSQTTRDALSRFNTLLQSGAYDNATGEDIAAATRATGISSSMIQAAVNANKDKNNKTEIKYSEDNNGNVTAVVINSKTGEVVKKTNLGAIGTAKTETPAKNAQSQFLEDAKSVKDYQGQTGWVGMFPQLVKKYAPMMSLEEIYQLWAQSEPGKKWGTTPGEDPQQMKQLYDYYKGVPEKS